MNQTFLQKFIITKHSKTCCKILILALNGALGKCCKMSHLATHFTYNSKCLIRLRHVFCNWPFYVANVMSFNSNKIYFF